MYSLFLPISPEKASEHPRILSKTPPKSSGKYGARGLRIWPYVFVGLVLVVVVVEALEGALEGALEALEGALEGGLGNLMSHPLGVPN